MLVAACKDCKGSSNEKTKASNRRMIRILMEQAQNIKKGSMCAQSMNWINP
jgi:hypothetical protein